MDTLILLIAAAAGLIWIIWFLLRGSLVGGCLAVIVASALLGYATWHPESGLPLTIDRAVAAMVLLAYVIHRRYGWANPKPLGRAEWVLLALLAVLTLSTFTHDWKNFQGQPAAQLVLYWFIPAALYWVARQAPITTRALRWTFGILALFGVYLSLTALAEVTGQWWAVLPRYISSPKLEFFGRARGPFLNPAGSGIYLTVCLAAALIFWPRLRRPGQLALVGLTGLAGAAIVATMTRSVWMGGALGLGTFACLSLPRAWRGLLLGTGVALALLLVVANWDSIWNLKRDVNLSAAAAADSAELRPILAKTAWNMFLDRPLLGFGFGQYDHAKLVYLSDGFEEMPLERGREYVQHNAILALLTDTGALGAGLFLLLLGLWVRTGWRLWKSAADHDSRFAGLLLLALIGAYLPNAMFHDTSIIDGVNLVLFIVAGLASGLLSMQPVTALAQCKVTRNLRQPVCAVA